MFVLVAVWLIDMIVLQIMYGVVHIYAGLIKDSGWMDKLL